MNLSDLNTSREDAYEVVFEMSLVDGFMYSTGGGGD